MVKNEIKLSDILNFLAEEIGIAYKKIAPELTLKFHNREINGPLFHIVHDFYNFNGLFFSILSYITYNNNIKIINLSHIEDILEKRFYLKLNLTSILKEKFNILELNISISYVESYDYFDFTRSKDFDLEISSLFILKDENLKQTCHIYRLFYDYDCSFFSEFNDNAPSCFNNIIEYLNAQIFTNFDPAEMTDEDYESFIQT